MIEAIDLKTEGVYLLDQRGYLGRILFYGGDMICVGLDGRSSVVDVFRSLFDICNQKTNV